jgi:hypothetical protein
MDLVAAMVTLFLSGKISDSRLTPVHNLHGLETKPRHITGLLAKRSTARARVNDEMIQIRSETATFSIGTKPLCPRSVFHLEWVGLLRIPTEWALKHPAGIEFGADVIAAVMENPSPGGAT